VTPGPVRLPLQDLLTKVEAQGYSVLNIGIFSPANYSDRFVARKGKEILFTFVDPYTGQVLGGITPADRDKTFARRIYLLHTRLIAGVTGGWIVEITTILTALLMLTGLIVWWPRKIFSVRRSSSWRRFNFDLHSAIGFFGSAIGLIMSLTGVWMAHDKTLNPMLQRLDASAPAPIPRVPTIRGQKMMNLDELSAIADQALPGAETRFIANPGSASVISFGKRLPEDHTPGGRSVVYLNQYTGDVLLTVSTRTQGTGTKLINMVRSLHTGSIFGGPSEIVFGLSTLSLTVLSITGFLMWWRPRRKQDVRAGERAAGHFAA